MITIRDNDDGTWTVLEDGKPGARIIIAPMTQRDGEPSLSIDVQPVVDSKLDAIVFGADAAFDGDRLVTLDSGKPNGQIRDGAQPFVCVAIYPHVEDQESTDE